MPRVQYERSPCKRDIGALGVITGLTLSHQGQDKLHYFGGLPYALPPVGPFRFKRPQPLAPCYRYGHTSEPGVFDNATGLCPQPGRSSDPSTWDENCLGLNIYVPAGAPPEGGWPVFFYIHGGFLQFGSANEKPEMIAPLLSETDFGCIVVMPAYRLNVFGFLASNELDAEASRTGERAGNYGFWDQRLALEWTWKNISLFGGNHSRIVIGGYSAGAHSAFQQLAHELYFVPDSKAVIKGVVMWSNGPGVQAKTLVESQEQFDELLTVLGLPLNLDAAGKLARLRNLPAETLIAAQDKMKRTEFRALSDDSFVSSQTIADLNSGDFGRRMKRRGIRLMNGENRDEHNLYRAWRTPSDTYDDLETRLQADFPRAVVKRLLAHYCPAGRLPADRKDWIDLFGHIYADMQVHGLERGFQDRLSKAGLTPGTDIIRYRIERRMSCVDAVYPVEWGVTHATDLAIWWWGSAYGEGLTDAEQEMVRPLVSAFAAFVKGEPVASETQRYDEAMRLRADGKMDVWKDEHWDAGVELWNVVNTSAVRSQL